MGIFDFIKDIGKKPEKDDQLEASLRQAIAKSGLGLKDFNVELKDGKATISGTALSVKDLELARLIVGNYQGVEQVNDDAMKVVPLTPTPLIQPQAAAAATIASAAPATPVAPERAGASSKMVTVKSGDTLSKLAQTYLGSAKRYPEIFEANRPMLKDADEIYPGQVLRIPPELSAPQ